MHSVLSKLPFAIFLLITLPSQYGSTPLSPPPRAPGDKVVIVVHNDSYGGIGPAPLPPMGKEIRSERKSIFAGLGTTLGLKRQGHFMTKSPSSEDSPGKKEKSLLNKLIPSSSRHVSGPSDLFRKNFHHSVKGPPPPNEKRPGPSFADFRPHQPDITPGIGKFQDEPNFSSLMPRPTPMANKLNPYTNGVAASFPPGIDPYDGFMRYAAENLETPMGNLIDYQSLEHYYGPQHPLSPHHNKDVSLNQPYADHFTTYNGNDIGNSPPAPPIPDGPPPPPPTFHGGGGFRVGSNNPSGHGNIGGRNNNPNSLNNYEHGIDHFDAPSPGPLHSAPPRPRPPTDQALYEEGIGHRNPPFDHNSEYPPYRQNHHEPPFKHGNSPPEPEHHHPDPPDMDVFDEGPPPPNHPLTGPSGEGQTHPEVQQSNNDGGDDSIWGILDLAEMIEKGEIPGLENTASSPPKSFNKVNHKPPPLPPSPFQNSPGGVGGKRIVIPIFTRPPPPRQSNPSHGIPNDDHPPPHSSSPHKISDNPDGYDYDEHPEGEGEGGDEGEGGNFPQDANKRHPQYGGPLDSHESNNDYADDSYKRK